MSSCGIYPSSAHPPADTSLKADIQIAWRVRHIHLESDTVRNDLVSLSFRTPVVGRRLWFVASLGSSVSRVITVGTTGGIVINGPASANYDTDVGVIFLNDWSHQTADEQYLSAQINGPPTQDTGLINGTNISDRGGSRFELKLTAGKKYRLRLINAAIETHFRFEIDNHNLTVMANDLVPIRPYSTQVLNIAMGISPPPTSQFGSRAADTVIGQRYDIVVEATGDSATNYWMRAVPASACSENANIDGIRGIVRYALPPWLHYTV